MASFSGKALHTSPICHGETQNTSTVAQLESHIRKNWENISLPKIRQLVSTVPGCYAVGNMVWLRVTAIKFQMSQHLSWNSKMSYFNIWYVFNVLLWVKYWVVLLFYLYFTLDPIFLGIIGINGQMNVWYSERQTALSSGGRPYFQLHAYTLVFICLDHTTETPSSKFLLLPSYLSRLPLHLALNAFCSFTSLLHPGWQEASGGQALYPLPPSC